MRGSLVYRLIGTVTVEDGGCYVMHPGVHAGKEYIEGRGGLTGGGAAYTGRGHRHPSQMGAVQEFSANVVQGALKLDYRKFTVDFREVKKLPTGVVKVSLGRGMKFGQPEFMRIEAITFQGSVPGYYRLSEPGVLYFMFP